MTQPAHITVLPPLSLQAGLARGSVTSLNSDSLLITWEAEVPLEDHVAQVILHNGTVASLHLRRSGERYYAADSESKAKLVDLLHQIRKEQHIELCAKSDVEHSKRLTGFENIRLPHVALPELAWSDLSTDRSFLGRTFKAPFLVTGMTGGIEQAAMINRRLASAASALQIPMGVGSQRLALENPAHASIFELKREFPKLFLMGNIGIGQLRRPDFLDLCRRAVDMIDADALAIHVNVLQELVQVEGDRDFRGILERISVVVQNLGLPVMVKEVGAGMDAATVKRLYDRNVRAVDMGGSGGTSWAFIEGQRSASPDIQRLGTLFRDWGIPTAQALQGAVELQLKDIEFVATGGMRDGVTALKALRLGACMVGFGLPLFKAALRSDDGPQVELEALMTELKIAMMCSGTPQL